MCNNIEGPLVTVAMPVYNAGRFLRAAVLSVVYQTYQNWELILIDDGSIDNSLETISDIVDARIHVHRDGVNKGLAARLNEALDISRGKYFARMDQDDVSYPERLEKQVAKLESDFEIDLVGVRSIAISQDDIVLGILPYALNHEELCDHPWLGFYLPHPTWLGRADWFRCYRYANPAPFFCEDQELLLRSYGASRFSTLPQVLFAYRMRSRVNIGKQLRTRQALARIQLAHFSKTGEWGYVILALISALGRVLSDMFFIVALRAKNTQALLKAEYPDQEKWRSIKARLDSKR